MKDIAAWQKEFHAAPSVWIVEDTDGCMTGVYESKEAAMLEVQFSKPNRYRCCEVHIHSLALARRRWLPAAGEDSK